MIVSFVPERVRLDAYAGDAAAVRLTAKDAVGDALPLEGEVVGQVRQFRDEAEPAAEFTVLVEDNVATLSLTGEQTAELGDFRGAWDVQWTPPGAEPLSLVQGQFRCFQDVSRG